MNIAILIPELGGGGAERVAQRIGDYYIQHGENVYYFLGEFGIKSDYNVKGHVIKTGIRPLNIANQYGMLFLIINLICNAYQLRKLKKKYRIDVSISFMEEFNYLNILSRAGDRVIIRVCTILSVREDCSGCLYRKDWIKHVYSLADHVVVISTLGLQEMRDIYGIPEKKISVIPNPAPAITNLPISNEKWEYGDKSVVFIGRLDPVKQPDRMLRVFCYVQKNVPEARLLILGKGKLDCYLKGLCRKYGLEKNVVFLGFVHNTHYYLRHAAAFVITSKVEGFGNVIIEAMAHGVPVITTDSPGGVRDILLEEGEWGMVTPPMPKEKVELNDALTEEEIVFGKAVVDVLTNRELNEMLREKSRHRVKKYDIENVMMLWNRLCM